MLVALNIFNKQEHLHSFAVRPPISNFPVRMLSLIEFVKDTVVWFDIRELKATEKLAHKSVQS